MVVEAVVRRLPCLDDRLDQRVSLVGQLIRHQPVVVLEPLGQRARLAKPGLRDRARDGDAHVQQAEHLGLMREVQVLAACLE
ncbi:hypothetical protein ACFYW8_28560 [Streptomyces sp. NPDC002742]|uniref:hypothetical protein n=1 Tax=Streptomyces sp. NPDC002742 TaxID=3364663 RepID=UPI0036AFB25F